MTDGPTVPAFLLIVTGIAVAVGGFAHFAPGQVGYHHVVEPVEDVPPDARVVAYDDLSPEAQSVVDAAIEDDGEVTVNADARPPEWTYGTDAAESRIVRYMGAHYAVATTRPRHPGLAWFGGVASLVVGLTVAVPGIWLYRTGSASADPA